MKLQSIKVSQCYESGTNPRGKDFEGPAFDDLVASVKEKGVLVPVIVRTKKKGDKLYEVIAGNRRHRASVKAGLKEIPARVENYKDDEAQEVQIIENLQREDVHPLEEGEAYRKLIEESRHEVKAVAAKVGKSETYVRQRLFLTNLCPRASKAYREGKFNDGFAVEIAKLAPDNQIETVRVVADPHAFGRPDTVNELKSFIKRKFYDHLDFQPWLKDEEANKAVGLCKECPPNRPTLFGDVKEGACTSLKCWDRKMEKYVNYIANNAKPKMTKVTLSYGYSSSEKKDFLCRNEYHLVEKKKDRCEFTRDAIVCKDEDRGKIVQICTAKKCKKHSSQQSEYELTPEEKKKRKEEAAKERKKREAAQKREDKRVLKAVGGLKWPMSEKLFDVLLEMIRNQAGTDCERRVGKRHEWEPLRTKDKYRPKGYIDWGKTVKEKIKSMSKQEKLQLMAEILIEKSWGSDKTRAMKNLTK